MRPCSTTDGPSGLALARTAAAEGDPYRLAILDLCMPGMDGLQLATALVADPLLTATHTMILTSAGPLSPTEALRAGVREWTSKPVRFSELLNGLLRLVSSPVDTPACSSDPAATTPARSSRGSVLVVEDNAINQVVAEGTLTKLGFTVTVVGDGRQGLDALTTQDYDVVLMDCHMPVMDGFEATAELRRRQADGRRTPIIAMTAGVLPEDRQRCLSAGMDDFLAKPVDVGVLDTVLTRWTHGANSPATRPVAGATAPLGPQGEDPLDRDRLEVLRRLGPADGWGLLPAVIVAFVDAIPVRLATLQDAVRSGGGPPLAEAAHQLKGSAANIGAPAVAELCQQLEASSRSDGPTHSELLDRLETELERAERALTAALPMPA